MAISFHCGCGKLLRTREELAGKKAKCPECGVVVTIPTPSPTPTPAEEPDDLYGLLADPRTEKSPAPAASPEADGYGLASGPEDEPQPSSPQRFRPSVEAPSTFRPTRAPAVARPRNLPEPVVSESSPREFLYILLILALIPLAFSLLQKDERSIEDRLEKTMSQAPPEVEQRVKQLAGQEGAGLDDLLPAWPNGKLDDSAHLPRKTLVHWLYAVVAAIVFWSFALLLFPGEKKTPLHLLLIGLFTGTAGIILLLGFQFLARATRGVVMTRGNIVVLILFYIAKFIGFSYDSANDPDTNFALSFLGFTCGVGLCEELCKALPLIGYFRRDARMGWRGACLWGLASGVGFGVSVGVMYSARYYNGVGPASIYLVRFVSVRWPCMRSGAASSGDHALAAADDDPGRTWSGPITAWPCSGSRPCR